MPYDPAVPATNAELTSAMFRGQFQGLADLMAAFQNITAVVIDGVTTLNPGEAATVTVSIIGTVMHLEFGIPRGDEGLPGTAGNDGAQGPPFAQLIIDSVTTLSPGSPATVGDSFDGTAVHLSFGIPAGQQGTPGTDGPPGEVTNAAMATAISMAVSGTSNNSNAVATLDTPFADPDAESMRQAHNALVLALRR